MIKHLFLLLGIISLVACSNEIEESVPSQGKQQIVMKVKDFQWSDKTSRTIVDVRPEGVFYNWAENDTVGIVPNVGTQVAFPIINGVGSNTATFSGGAWALRPSSTYAAYSPFIGDIYLDKTAIPVNYTGQTQVGNASTAHLGKYDFMTAVANTPTNGNVNFEFEHLGALIELSITLPKAGIYSNVTLSCTEPVFTSIGKVDLTSTKPTITAIGKKSNELTIRLQDFASTKDNEIVKVYFITAPVDLTGKNIKVSLDGANIDYTGTVNIGKLNAGYAYAHSVLTAVTDDLWVDLGLPSGTLWATQNVGASSSEDYGDYFAWGETAPKASYKTYSLTHNKPNSDISGNPQYDAATANWGAPARMPTLTECKELYYECTTQFTYRNGVGGCLVTGPNGNSIFLPAAGFWNEVTSSPYDNGYEGNYWSSTPHQSTFASAIFFDSLEFSWSEWERNLWISIRPVRN